MLAMLRDLLLNTILTRTAIFAFLLSSYDKMAAAAKKQRVPQRLMSAFSKIAVAKEVSRMFVGSSEKNLV